MSFQLRGLCVWAQCAVVGLLALALSTTASANRLADWVSAIANIKPTDLVKPSERAAPSSTSAISEVDRLFKMFDCSVPPQLKAKVQRANEESFIPKDLEDQLSYQSVRDSVVQKIAGISARGVLHPVAIPDGNTPSVPMSIRLVSAATYNTIEPTSLIDQNSDYIV